VKKLEREKEIRAWEDQEAERKTEAEAEGKVFEPNKKDFPEVKPAPFKSQKIQYVLCLNTMG
jgi:hypothetical protein